MSEWKISLSDVNVGEEEAQAVAEVVRSRWLTAGPKTAQFEAEFAKRCQVPHALAVTNCTAALEMAYAVLGVGPGVEVIVPSLTFVATANAVRSLGGTPIFADIVSADDFTIDPEDVRRKITPRTKAVAVVHYGGYPGRMDALLQICEEHKLALVEDCAHAPGGMWQDRPLGSIGDVGCFSFFGNKNMTTGEGGMLTTRRADLAEQLRLLRSHGMTTGSWDRFKGHASMYDVVLAGHNHRSDDLKSAIGLVQLSRLDAANTRRKELVLHYRRCLEGLVDVPFSGRIDSVFHLMVVLLPKGTERAKVMAEMKARGIQTSVHYPPAHLFRIYEGGPVLPRLEALAAQILTLPLYPAMRESDVEMVVEALRESLAAR